MKVIYELEAEDIKQILADKYGAKIEKISLPFIGSCRIDMSDIESWEPIPKKPAIEEDVSTINYIEPEEPATAPERVISTDYDLTDEEIRNFVKDNISVAELCRHYNWDKKSRYRLYKRFEKARLESAS